MLHPVFLKCLAWKNRSLTVCQKLVPTSFCCSYQTLTNPVTKTYTTHSECSIEFEVDGPYKVTCSL